MNKEIKSELFRHFVPTLSIFLLFALAKLTNGSPPYHILLTFLGLALGSFLLDIDHLVYWFVVKPELAESQEAKRLVVGKNWRGILGHLGQYHKTHTNLIFHHFHFHLLLLGVALFVFLSTNSLFTKAFVVSLNLHLLTDISTDYLTNPQHLRTWLFARSPFVNIKLSHLRYYLIFSIITILYLVFRLFYQ